MRIFTLAFYFLIFLTSCSMPAPQVEPVNSPDFTSEVPLMETNSPTLEVTKILQFPTPGQSDTPDSVEPQILASPNPSPTVESVTIPDDIYPFKIQTGTPVGTVNFVDPQLGCNWLGVGGQVFAGNDKAVTGMIVEIGGTLNGDPVLLLALTGDNTVLGPGGYVIKVADKPIASEGTLWVQLFDLNGNPKSEKVAFNTYGGDNACDRNLIVINFSELSTSNNEFYFPSIYKNGQ